MAGGLPRLGGGVSWPRPRLRPLTLSSPPRRGCFRELKEKGFPVRVFPASAGVFPYPIRTATLRPSLPRLGGGVSISTKICCSVSLSSPPRRGCFREGQQLTPHHRVFPASAGVFPPQGRPSSDGSSLPRLGGGVSNPPVIDAVCAASSPPRRGCFRLIDFVMNYFFDESHYEII